MTLRQLAFLGAFALSGQFAAAELENTGYFLCLQETKGACRPSFVADDMCDAVCNIQACNFDGGDCPTTNPPTTPPATAAPTASETAPPPPANGGYKITVLFTDEDQVTPAVRQAFDNAVARWSEVIIEDIPDITLSRPFSLSGCGASGSLPTGYVLDDLVIAAAIEPIDGPGSILGSAGPCAYDGNDFPRVGSMRFDTADLATLQQRGTLEAVILHEMGHVIGIGTSWRSRFNLINGLNSPANDPEYNGEQGILGHEMIGAAKGSLPKVANTGGAGTRGGHWREATYGDELMTGFLSGGAQPMSRLTINSLKDLGYTVDLTKADAFSISRSAGTAGYASKIQSRMENGETYGDDVFSPETIYTFDKDGGFTERKVSQGEEADNSGAIVGAAFGLVAVGTAMVAGSLFYVARKKKAEAAQVDKYYGAENPLSAHEGGKMPAL